MKHLKQILKIFVFLILVCCGVLFASCGNDGGTAVISCSNAQLDIVLGEDESKTFNINVSGGQFDMSSLVVESFEENSIIGIEVKKYSNNFATVVVSPIAPGSATIKVSGGSNSAEPQQVLVNVIMPIESISLKQEFDGKLYAIKGGSVKLYSLNFVQYSAKDVVGFERYETNQKGYSLKLANSNLENVSLQNGVLSVGENFQGDSISLIAESNYYDQYNQNENLKFTFDVKVLNQITTEVYVNTDKGLKLEDGVTVSSPITDGQAISLFPKEETQNSATIYVYAYVNNQADEVMLVKNVDETRFDLELISASGFDSGLNAYKFVYKLTSFNAGFSDFINFTASYKNYTLGNKNQEYSAQTNKLAVKTYNRPQSVVANGVAKNTNLTVYENVSSVSKGSTLTLTLTPGNLASEYNLITLFVDDIVDVNNLPFDFYTMNATKTGFTKQVWSQNKTITISVGTKLFVVKNGNYSENNLSAIIYAQESSYFNEIGNERTKIAITVSVKPGASGIYLAGLNENSEYILLDETNLLGGSTKTIVADLNQQNEIILAISPSNFDIGLNSIAKVLNTKLASATSFEVLGADENYVYVKFNILPLAVGTTKLNIYLQDGSFAELNLKIVSKLEYFDVSINSDEATTIAKYYEKYADGENNYLKLAIQNGTNIQLNYEVNPTNAEYRLDFGFYDIENSGKTLSNENFADYIGGEFADQSAYINVTRLKNYGIVEAANSLAEGKVLVKITVFGIGEDGTEIEQSTHYVLVEVYRGVDSFNVSSSLIDVYSYDSVGSKNVMQSISEFTIRVQSNNGRPTYLENLEMFLGLNSSTKVEFNSGVARIEDENGEVLLTITKILTGNEYRFNVQAMSAKQNQFIFTFKLVEVAQNSPITALVRVNVKQAVEISYIELVNVDDEIYIDNYNNKNGSEFIVLTNVYAEDGKEPLNSKLIYELSSSLTSKGITVENGKISAPKNTSGVGTLTIYPESNYFDGTIVGEPVVTLNVVVANGENKETAIRLYTASDVANIADQQDVNKSNLHYVLVGNITLTNSISSFSGHLYGDFNNITSTLACENGAIFEELTSTAVVENLNVVGLLAKTNNGTIKNVCVLNSETISNTSEDFVGGLANINNGTIQNCQVEASISGKNVGGVAGKNAGTISNTLFAGTISASVNAGGIAAENEGTITSCKVEKWSENTGSMISATGSNSTYVGAIVGTNNSGAKIEKTYAYAYNQTSADIVAASATVGGIAGYNYGEISQCMTNFVVNDSLATKFASAGSGAITNSYILGADFAASHYQGVTDPEYYDAEIWGIEEGYNNNLPYLKSCYYPKPVSQIETEINEDSGILYSAEDNLIVLYYYDLTETLSNEIAQTQLQNKNTYAISKILSSTEGLSIKSTSSIIKVSGGNLIVRGVGKATLKLQSNYATQDCEEMEITVCVIYPVINFDVYSGTAINGGNVVKNSALIRRATDSILSTAVSNKIILNNTAYEFTSNLYAVLFNAKNAADYDANSAILGISTNYSIEDKKEKPLSIGTFIIKPYEIKPDENGKEFDNFTLTATLALQNENLNNFYPDFTAGDISKINLLIGEKFNKT
ncbi:MAG: hypothetical protein J5779_02920, partial [Clostridia bacterium]|nr:hypothetical protein [Clostridia bacterium]